MKLMTQHCFLGMVHFSEVSSADVGRRYEHAVQQVLCQSHRVHKTLISCLQVLQGYGMCLTRMGGAHDQGIDLEVTMFRVKYNILWLVLRDGGAFLQGGNRIYYPGHTLWCNASMRLAN